MEPSLRPANVDARQELQETIAIDPARNAKEDTQGETEPTQSGHETMKMLQLHDDTVNVSLPTEPASAQNENTPHAASHPADSVPLEDRDVPESFSPSVQQESQEAMEHTHDNSALPQSHHGVILSTEPVSSQVQQTPVVAVPSPIVRRDSQEARDHTHDNAPISYPQGDTADNNQSALQTGHQFPLPLDVDSQDNDSALGLDLQSSTMSLRSSLYESIEENGRTYHKYKQGNYLLPNDEIEQSRLDLQHHLFLLTLDGKLNLAPVSDPKYVLDIGTGTGIWAIEYAIEHPEAAVTGVDLSAIQPDFVPSNCQFEVDDVEDEWAYNRQPDYIHGRALFTCFKDPRVVFQKAYDALAPGGYFEMQDVFFKYHSNDGTVDGTALEKWNYLLIEGAAKIGRDWHCTPHYAQWFMDVGFEDVVENKFAWPCNPWPKGKKQKTMGLWSLTNALDGISSISMAMMTRNLGMPAKDVEVMLVDVRRDQKDRSIHAYYPVYVVYGRKPL